MPKTNLFLEQDLDDPRVVSTDPRKARVVRQRDPGPDTKKRPWRRRTSDTSRPTIVHRLHDGRGIVALARADALHTSIMDAMNTVFDAMLHRIETGRLDRRDRARGFVADTLPADYLPVVRVFGDVEQAERCLGRFKAHNRAWLLCNREA